MPVFTITQHVLSSYHAMGYNPVSMVDPLGLAFTLPSTWGTGSPTALDIALWQVPTKQLDKVYGGDPWSMKNRGALNDYEADMAGKQIVIEAVTGLLSVRRYNYYVGLEKQMKPAYQSNQADKNTQKMVEVEKAVSNGISNRLYTIYDNCTFGGLMIMLGYKDQNTGYTDFNWIQTITTNKPPYGVTSPYNDPQPADDDLPFYYTNDEIPSYINQSGFDLTFDDNPFRYISATDNVTWKAELTLVGKKNGDYHAITTMTYGFEINNGIVSLIPFTFTTISDFNKSQFSPTLINPQKKE